jgi:uncharacterized membrane protein
MATASDNTNPDQGVEQALGNLLRAGVILAATVAAIGGGMYLFAYGGQSVRDEPAEYQKFRGEPASLTSPAGIVRAALEGSRRALIGVGLLLLIGTPVARVVFSVLAFARQRDVLYVVITLIVLTLLIFSLVGITSG